MTSMPHRRMGRSGLQLSLLSFGSWVTFGNQVDTGLAVECLAAARAGGVTFFDNAEAYGGGESERSMGAAIAQLGGDRQSYTISTKLFWGLRDEPNMRNTLNRKYLMQAMDGSLERFGLDFVDLVYCHRPDPKTPILETVWAMSDLIAAGKAHYWGTSEWSGAEIAEAVAVADRHHLHAPVVEQPQYNLFERRRVEQEYARLYDSSNGLGLTTWSPLASGLLTGKYLDGVPEGSRGSLPGYEWLRDLLTNPKRNDIVRELAAIAEGIDVSTAQLAISWCASNPHVTSVILGASSVDQVTENLGALDALERLTPEVSESIELLFLR
jgi:voltage-dependent potassium channel beta subunit